jgi:hypothetical protein
VLGLGVLVLIPSVNAQTTAIEARPLLVQAQPGPKNPAPAAAIAPIAPEPPVFLSDEWRRKEQLTEDRLRRIMNICKGC